MRPDHRAVDHVGGSLAPCQFGQGLEHSVEHPDRDPSVVTAEDAVPLLILIRQMAPLRTGPREPDHTLEVAPVILRRATTATALRWQQRPDQCPFLGRYANPLAQCRLEAKRECHVNFCPRDLDRG